MAKNPTMVEAGKKAWETRRANERHEDYVKRGKKAWATRRKNANKKK